jgi:hypothetical protein
MRVTFSAAYKSFGRQANRSVIACTKTTMILAHHFQFGAQSFRRWGALRFASTVWHVADHSATRPGAALRLAIVSALTHLRLCPSDDIRGKRQWEWRGRRGG